MQTITATMDPAANLRAVSPADAGEPLTAEELVSIHLPRVRRFAIMVSPWGSDPEDLAQQAMLRALERPERWESGRGSFDAWLWRVVVNLARDAGRLSRRTELLIGRLGVHERGSADVSPEALALDRLRDEQLIEAVRRLPRRHRSLIALRYGAGLSAAETAACLGTTRMAVAKALRRALDRLRADLEHLEVDE